MHGAGTRLGPLRRNSSAPCQGGAGSLTGNRGLGLFKFSKGLHWRLCPRLQRLFGGTKAALYSADICLYVYIFSPSSRWMAMTFISRTPKARVPKWPVDDAVQAALCGVFDLNRKSRFSAARVRAEVVAGHARASSSA